MRRQRPNCNKRRRHFIELQPLVQILFSVQCTCRKIGHHVLFRLPLLHHERAPQTDQFIAEMLRQTLAYARDEIIGARAPFRMHFDHFAPFSLGNEEIGEQSESAFGVRQDFLDWGAVDQVYFGDARVLVHKAAGDV